LMCCVGWRSASRRTCCLWTRGATRLCTLLLLLEVSQHWRRCWKRGLGRREKGLLQVGRGERGAMPEPPTQTPSILCCGLTVEDSARFTTRWGSGAGQERRQRQRGYSSSCVIPFTPPSDRSVTLWRQGKRISRRRRGEEGVEDWEEGFEDWEEGFEDWEEGFEDWEEAGWSWFVAAWDQLS
jgi:hypothetical protein